MESSRRTGHRPSLADTVRAAKPASDQLAGFAGDPNFMLSLARGLTVLEAFSERKRPLTISQVAQRTQLSRASVRRCLYTLEQLGYVSQQDGQFALRPRVLHRATPIFRPPRWSRWHSRSGRTQHSHP